MKVKNISGEDRIVGGRLLLAGADLEVAAEDVWSYTCQESNWAPADGEAKAIHEAALPAVEPVGDPSVDWTKKQLVAHAAQHGVDLTGANTKAEIFDAITNHTPEG